MRRVRLVACLGVVLLIVGALPAAADTNDWGTWAFTGHWKSWSGTFFDAHRVTGVVMGLRALKRYNQVTAFSIAGKTCQVGNSLGTGTCYTLNIPPNKKVKWKLTTDKPLTSSDQIVPAIKWNGKYHSRYGNG
jgi:hypothetical protein